MFISLRPRLIRAVPDAVDRAINNPKWTKRLIKYAVVVAARLVVFSLLCQKGLRHTKSTPGPLQPALRQ